MAHGGGNSGITCFGSSSCCSFPQFPGEKEEKNGGGEGKCILLNLFGVKEKEREGKISYGHVGKSREQKCILELFQKKKKKSHACCGYAKKKKNLFLWSPPRWGFFSRPWHISSSSSFLVLPVFLGFGLLLGIDASGIHSFLGKRKENMLENVKMSPFRPSAAARAFLGDFFLNWNFEGDGKRTLKFFFENFCPLAN